MSKLTSFLTMLTKHLFIYALFFTLVLGASLKKNNLVEDMQENKCVFPPANLTIPPKCSEFYLSSFVSKDLRSKDNVEFYLCTALLDSTKRLCSLVTKNLGFHDRVAEKLNESLPTIMSSNSNEKFCDEMNLLDVNTTMDQAKFMYSKLKSTHCVSICVGVDDDEMQQRAPICKSIQFAHQQIFEASDLQKSLNDNAHKQTDDEDDSNKGFNPPVHNESPKLQAGTQIQASLTGVQSQSAHVDSPDQARLQSLANNEALEGSSNKRLPSGPSGQASDIASGANSPAIEAPQLPAAAGRPIPPKPAGRDGAVLSPDGDSQRSSVDNPEGRSSAKSKTSTSVTENLGKPSPQNLVGPAAVAPSKVVDNGNDGNAAELDNLPLTEDHEDKGEGFQEKDPLDPVDNLEIQKSPPENDEEEEDEVANEDLTPKQLESQREATEGKSSSNFKVPNLSSLSKEKPISIVSGAYGNFVEAEDSHFFAYFMSISALCVLGYLVYHNKRKIIAMAVEGKKSRSTGRRRPNSASYHKLDSNLEEAMSSNLASTNSYVIY